ncbi:hypothetical protein OESDEN_10720 [Oesophagostomum dentatum]|uniref:Uncharacterized protein n=1 Tax=Oesophagostomum dentatum TaxID=61180 RepID=A0A0B1SWV0_OESDE|nr:hypothetical protein OESDEN_10720 [Oesophagostomum dentatum]
MTTVGPQRQYPLFLKLGIEVRPPPLAKRDEKIRSMTCSFEEIAESEEEEDIQVKSFDLGYAVASRIRRSDAEPHRLLCVVL